MNKKGFLQGDSIYFMAMFFMLGIVVVIGYYVLSNINTEFQADTLIPTEAKTVLSKWTTKYNAVFEWFMVTVILGIFIGFIVTAYYLQTNPVFTAISLLILIIAVGISIYLANAYYSFSSSSGITQYAEAFPITQLIMNKLPIFMVFIMVIYIIILYAKGGNQPVI
jgi:F0F1-type ATP synthase assembly protein I